MDLRQRALDAEADDESDDVADRVASDSSAEDGDELALNSGFSWEGPETARPSQGAYDGRAAAAQARALPAAGAVQKRLADLRARRALRPPPAAPDQLEPHQVSAEADDAESEGSAKDEEDESDGVDGNEEGEEEDAEDAEDDGAAGEDEGVAKGAASEARGWAALGLSRALQRAVRGALGFEHATGVQAAAVPLVLAGRDVVAAAATGSGKTLAFALPLLDRLLLLRRDARAALSLGPRVLVLSPTRELAVQTHAVLQALCAALNRGAGADLAAALAVGGLSVAQQERALAQAPDVLVATPGRLIDLLRNARGVALEHCEALVLDEADRLLDSGFRDELDELLRQLGPRPRQTLLFSATLSADVEALVKRACKTPPARVAMQGEAAAQEGRLVPQLAQEFVRVRDDDPSAREAALLALVTRTYSRGTLVFATHKRTAHRLALLLSLAGVAAAELHGNLTQALRLEALERFRSGVAHVLVCTDVASRGLDLAGVACVLNFELPSTLRQYVHRVGRTARAGRSGTAVSLVGQADRKLLRLVLKAAPSKHLITHRHIAPDVLRHFAGVVHAFEPDIKLLIEQERAEREIRLVEQKIQKKKNMVAHRDEIKARPARTWFQSAAERKEVKAHSNPLKNATATGKKARSTDAPSADKKRNRDNKHHKSNNDKQKQKRMPKKQKR